MKPPAPKTDSARVRAVCCGLALVTVLVYLPAWTHGFVLFDDDDYITKNRVVQAGLSWAGVKWAFTTWHAGNWHPLTWLSHMLDCQLFGLNAGAHHLVSVLIHSANSVLVLLVWWRLTRALWPSALVAALFAWHPLHVESVAWAAERKDVLSALFFLFTLLAYACYAQAGVQQDNGPHDRGPKAPGVLNRQPVWYIVAVASFSLGLLSKPMVVTLPFVLLLLDCWPLERMKVAGSGALSSVLWKKPDGTVPTFNVEASDDRRLKTQNSKLKNLRFLLLEKAPFLGLSAACCVVTYLAQRATAVATLREHPMSLRLANAPIAYARYLLMTIWPTRLAVIYPPPDRIPWGELLVAAPVLAVISALVWSARRGSPYLLAGWLWYVGTLVPVIGIVQVGNQALADRYTYIPLIGVFVAASFGTKELMARHRFSRLAVSIGVGLVLLSLLAATRRQLGWWRDSVWLFGHAVEVTTDNSIAHVNLAAAYEQQGRTREALIHYREGLRIAEEHPHLSDTLVTPAQKAVAYSNLGGAFEKAGYSEEAAALYSQAVGFDPTRADFHQHLGSLLVSMNRFDEAMRELAAAARLDPKDPRPHYLMGAACFRTGKTAEAIADFREALRLNTNDVDSLTFLSRMLAWDADPKIRNPSEAVALAEHANQLSGGRVPMVLDSLAIAYADMERFDEAQKITRKAIELAGPAEQKELVPAMQRRLLRYQAGQPYREGATNSVPGSGQPVQP